MTSGFEESSGGKALYGDAFSADQIETWFRDEKEASYKLPEERAPGAYSYHALNFDWATSGHTRTIGKGV